jgi:hypothetical protein
MVGMTAAAAAVADLRAVPFVPAMLVWKKYVLESLPAADRASELVLRYAGAHLGLASSVGGGGEEVSA